MSDHPTQILHVVLIKATRYDDDGYPIVWWRTLIPSNSLAAVNGIARDCIDRQVLGPNVRINLTTVDPQVLPGLINVGDAPAVAVDLGQCDEVRQHLDTDRFSDGDRCC